MREALKVLEFQGQPIQLGFSELREDRPDQKYILVAYNDNGIWKVDIRFYLGRGKIIPPEIIQEYQAKYPQAYPAELWLTKLRSF